jgi:enterobacterial common antigen flippase
MTSTPGERRTVVSPEEDVVAGEKKSYGQILTSSAMIGGSSLVNIALGILRTKAMALILGPSGVGLVGVYGSIADLVVAVAGMGVNTSGVRQIAEAVGSGDTNRIAYTAVVLRRVSVVLGLIGAGLLIALSGPISTLTFGGPDRALAVCFLSVAVLCRLISAGQGALIQGMRRISDLAKMNAIGALVGTLLTIPLVYVLKEEGVVPALVVVAAASILMSWWYAKKVKITPTPLPISQLTQEVAPLLRLGFAFMVSGLLMMGSAYLIRVIVLRTSGVEAAGLYHAAWILGGLYVGMILQAMGADFYPRLSSTINDHSGCNRLVNQQARVSVLLAGPGVLGTLTFAPLVISMFYAAEFGAAVDTLRWICLGIALRVVSWPLGFIIMAKAHQRTIVLCELAWTVVHLGLAVICITLFGLTGAGIAFFGSYVFHIGLVYSIVRQVTGFRLSGESRTETLLYLGSVAAVFGATHLLPPRWATAFGTSAVLLSSIYSSRIVLSLVSIERLPRQLSAFITACRLVRADRLTSAD